MNALTVELIEREMLDLEEAGNLETEDLIMVLYSEYINVVDERLDARADWTGDVGPGGGG